MFQQASSFFTLGSPPHTRERLWSSKEHCQQHRITPAYAGKTKSLLSIVIKLQDHPRIRGKDSLSASLFTSCSGSPPHTRERHIDGASETSERRITPAYAGKTPNTIRKMMKKKDHPRIRGKDAYLRRLIESIRGSPPHTRERLSWNLRQSH